MKIQLSKTRIIPDAMTVWYEHGPDVDLVMDLKSLTFAPQSVEKLYAFHVLEHFYPSEIKPAIRNWMSVVVPGGKLFVVNDDFEFVCRSFIGGDLSIDQLNDGFTKPTHFTKDNMVASLEDAGAVPGSVVIWYADVTDEFKKAEHELVVAVNV